MVEAILQLVAAVLVIIGTAFSVLGVLGLIRLPDVYTRLHATGKVSVFGVVLIAGAAMFALPQSLGKAVVLVLLLLVAGPVVSHAISSAAYRLGIPVKNAIRDDLAEEKQKGGAHRGKTAE